MQIKQLQVDKFVDQRRNRQSMGGGSSKRRVHKIMLVGLDNSGKTTFVKSVQSNGRQTSPLNQQTAPTVGYSLERIIRGNQEYQIFDMSGQSKYREMWNSYCKEIQGIIFVIDSADSLRLQVVANELEMILEQEDIKNRPVPILFLANKADLPGALAPESIKEMLKLYLITDRKWEVLQTNSIKGGNINATFDWICSAILMAFPQQNSYA